MLRESAARARRTGLVNMLMRGAASKYEEDKEVLWKYSENGVCLSPLQSHTQFMTFCSAGRS